MGRIRLGTIAALSIAAGLMLPPTAFAAEKAIWGPLDLPDGRSAWRTYEDLGVDVLQTTLDWSATATGRPGDARDPSSPAYSWPTAVDRAVAEAGAHGIDVALLVTNAPGWANGGNSPIWAPTNPEDYADFLVAAARRYPTVRRWMVWGEPNRVDRFQPNAVGDATGPRAYAVLLDSAYAALKAQSRANVVIGAMTWSGGDVKPRPFLSGLKLPDGRRPRLDWYGHNPFPFRFPNLRELAVPGGYRDISDVDLFSREVRDAYGRRVKLWLSEFTIQSDGPSQVFELFVTREEQGRWLEAAYRIADEVPSVAGLGWLELMDQASGQTGAHWGLLDTAGAPKPAYRAFRLAPSRRFTPVVRTPTRARAGRRLRVRVRARARGQAIAILQTRRGRRLRATRREVRPARRATFRLATRGVDPGRYQLVVRAPRGETVTRPLRLN